jgi:hypothetical protein
MAITIVNDRISKILHQYPKTGSDPLFFLQGNCCASKVPAVRKIVKPLPGLSKLNINLTSKIVHVQHNISCINATQISLALSSQGVPTQIQRDGAHMVQAKQQALSTYAFNERSMLHVQGILQDGDDIETIKVALSSLNRVTRTKLMSPKQSFMLIIT